jgi:hypothetical protein
MLKVGLGIRRGNIPVRLLCERTPLLFELEEGDAARAQLVGGQVETQDERRAVRQIPAELGSVNRIAVVETLRREALDKLKKASKPKRGQISINEDTNFLEASFGETSSPFVRDLRTSRKLTLDMARPTD